VGVGGEGRDTFTVLTKCAKRAEKDAANSVRGEFKLIEGLLRLEVETNVRESNSFPAADLPDVIPLP